MKRINAVIVDDELSAVHTLRGMLTEFCPMVHVQSVANTVEQGARAVRQYLPDVVFLDIEMPPYGTGFDLLPQIEGYDVGIIFTTAYAHYAIQAINDAQPIAYLVKPIRVPDLVRAIHAATLRTAKKAAAQADPSHRGIVLTDARKGSIVIRFADILYCEADGACTAIYIRQEGGKIERLYAGRPLKEIETELPAGMFFRSHHSFVVNMAHIQRYDRRGRAGVIFLPRDTRVEVSANRMEPFVELFHDFLRGRAGR